MWKRHRAQPAAGAIARADQFHVGVPQFFAIHDHQLVLACRRGKQTELDSRPVHRYKLANEYEQRTEIQKPEDHC